MRASDHADGTKARRRGKAAPAFAQVRVAAVQPSLSEQLRLRAQLPNGVMLHFDVAGSPAQLAGWLAALGALACSV